MDAPTKPRSTKPRTITGHPDDFIGPVFYKECTECGESKCMFDFSRHSASARSRNPVCKVCNASKSRQYYDEHVEEVAAKAKVYRAKSAETIKQRKAEYFQANKVEIVAKRREERLANPEKYAQFWKDFYARHRDRLREKAKEARAKPDYTEKALHRNRRVRYADPARVQEYQRKYRERNSEKLKEAGRAYYHHVLKQSPQGRALREARYRYIGPGGFMSWSEFRALGAQAQELTKATGVEHVVDHIYPLISDRVCGLNTSANLRIVPRHVNTSKYNKLLHNLSHEHYAVDPWEVYYDTEETDAR